MFFPLQSNNVSVKNHFYGKLNYGKCNRFVLLKFHPKKALLRHRRLHWVLLYNRDMSKIGNHSYINAPHII